MPDSDLLTRLLAALRGLCPPDERWIVGVSGGVDSVVLLHLLALGGYDSTLVVHLNHRLRGREGSADSRFVARLAARLGFPCVNAAVDVAREAARSGVSVELAGRQARHRLFAECAERHDCSRVLLAHHAGDQAETILMNLFRGAGGLRGMEPITGMTVPGREQPLQLYRPLLAVEKADLLALAKASGWRYREDVSNTSPDYVRNRVRHELLPLAAEIFQRDPAPALLRAAGLASGAAAFLADAAQQFLSALPEGAGGPLPARTVRALPEPLQRAVLHRWLTLRGVPGVSFAVVERVRTILDPAAGPARVSLPGDLTARRTGGKVSLILRVRYDRPIPENRRGLR